MKEQLERAIRKNWWVGLLIAGWFLLQGDFTIATLAGVGALAWNLILYGVVLYVNRHTKGRGM